MEWAIVFDRDGTLIDFIDFISNPSEVKLIPGIYSLLKNLMDYDIKFFLHSNQSGVGRNFFTMKDFNLVQERFLSLLPKNFKFSDSVFAYGDPNKLSTNEKILRKPTKYLSEKIQTVYKIPISRIIYIGDSDCDLQSALISGCHGIGVLYGKSEFKEKYSDEKNIIFVSKVSQLEKNIISIITNEQNN